MLPFGCADERMKNKKKCSHVDPLRGFSYVESAIEAARLLNAGWKQEFCATCRLWAIWKNPKKGIRK